MAIKRQRRNVAYGVGQPLFGLAPEPISSTRAPTTSDLAELGTTWVRTSTNQSWILASVVSNSATWSPTTVNAGLTVSTGDIVVAAGDIYTTVGSIIALTGAVEGGAVIASDDLGGTGLTTTFTNTVDVALSTGAGVVLMKTVNPGDSSGWMKIYVGADARYIPYWTNLSP